MAVRRLRLVPDPVLHEVCAPVSVFDVALASLTRDMFETMYAATGRGLAAPQVGVTQRVFVMDALWKAETPTPMLFVNPEITARSETRVVLDEGCLSLPDQIVPVARPDAVDLRWQDLDGAWHAQQFTGFEAACVQHEIDHLDGILITEKPACPDPM